jgi:hypothetical protein
MVKEGAKFPDVFNVMGDLVVAFKTAHETSQVFETVCAAVPTSTKNQSENLRISFQCRFLLQVEGCGRKDTRSLR